MTGKNLQQFCTELRADEETPAELAVDLKPAAGTGAVRMGVAAREIGTLEIIMIGLAGVIGAGIFVASGIPIRIAGPAAVLSYLAGALVVIPVMLYLAEMEAAWPSTGAFSDYANRYLGPLMGFVTGWMYWSSGVLGMATEVTASALLVHWWLPGWPLWLFSLFFSLLITGINLLDIRGFTRIEGLFSGIKIMALFLFILAGLTVLSGLWPGLAPVGTVNYFAYGGFFPRGVKGVFASLLLVIFAYSGIQVVCMTAAQATNPRHTIPRAVIGTGLTVTFLYTCAIFVLVGLLPWFTVPVASSPFVTVLERLRIPFGSHLLNAIIITAVLSSMNTTMFGVTRMLKSLAERNEAPRFLLKTDRRGIPTRALAASSIFLSITVILAYLLPQKVFLYVASASGFISLFNWAVITVTYIRFRQKLPRFKAPFAVPGYPYLPYTSLLLLLVVVASVPLARGQIPGMVSGLLLAIAYAMVFFLFVRRRYKATA
ncbi:amino acid permease-associated region [Desulfofundulus kuznetsovii DSM 6115]|uniref:Amino acid permease-associated region n=1 Tax=Desulfofundulus kuznetsovii (strain DSM 6115 / VKM B-1805 / 17) TaxID=760568 RepID=A0AAU8Q0P7_DESK7|nr:amino acid permease-associated region [Desulfofundulus kuznetsovii DSM 6115]